MEDNQLVAEDINEQLEDLEQPENWADGAVLWSTDWTAETVISQLLKGNINLNPDFQRRSAWRNKKQSLFIESAILGLPIPQLILAEDKNKKGSFIVIDGKQRLLSIRRFAAAEGDDAFERLRLSGLEEKKNLNGKTYADLMNDENFADEITAFQNSSVRTVVIRNWQSESYLYEVFLRINTGSVQLSPQELRQALHPGPFSKFVDDESAESVGLKSALNLKEPDFRMRDAEILLRFIAYKNFAHTYSGNLKQFLDDTTRDLNGSWDTANGMLVDQVREMENAFAFTEEVFGYKSYLRKWKGDEFEARKNRAIFDIMLHFFSQRHIREACAEKQQEVVDAFKRLCSEDEEFLGSIERTTKSVDANYARFNKWAVALSEIANITIERIEFGA